MSNLMIYKFFRTEAASVHANIGGSSAGFSCIPEDVPAMLVLIPEDVPADLT